MKTTSTWALRAVVLFYLGVLIGLPVTFLVVKALGHGFGPFWSEVTQPNALSALKLSLEVAAIAVPINAVVGVGAALLIARHKFVGKRVLDTLFDVPIAISPIIIGIALVLAYSKIGWFGAPLTRYGIKVLFSPLGIILATMSVSLPYVLRSILPVLTEVGEDQEQAARTLGAGRFRIFWNVTLPSIRWAVLYGVTLTIARTLGEFGAVLVVSGNITGVTQTLPIYIFDSWDQRFDVLGSYSGALVLALISIGVLAILAALKRREKNLLVDFA
ncbi:MAG TPA: sulfate ABC transporter permease subunit [Acidimicrobiales bacterium]|nr:sulfate ABC transporter permease subunit [Acidimicrobiales bacterium]